MFVIYKTENVIEYLVVGTTNHSIIILIELYAYLQYYIL